ncbi:afadin- and alpha-actinin-binding protein B-like [Mizuhopecten yessoensis]|uniref:Afadin-and alpha-actinin-binding protein n=1 Tax=Mizuhopecten yessoensis TaxID=6573 RepID=A0A210PNQ3_MIZYE|nr:afadin- and alpha-actinin-binding protein B-like [Mizuhopecten yessoensis]OWF38122.1 Afadin- and alpha-actinin-binding protein [Mizuhopecten yessoensis]
MADWSVLRNAGRDYLTLYGSRDVTASLSAMTATTNCTMQTPSSSFSYLDKTDENTFCCSENVEDCVTFLNQELTALGFQTIDHGDGATEVSLVNRLYEIFRLHQKARRFREELENRLRRLSSETEHYQSSNHRLKNEKVQLEREIGKEQEKCRQVVIKQKSLSEKFKAEKDEVKRLQCVIRDRDGQYKHELKKKERELNKMKEKLHHLITDKNPNRRMGLDIANSLQRADGKRSQWKTGSHDKQEEMYQLVIHNYEDKQRELMIENTDLRDCLVYMQRELGTIINHSSDVQTSHTVPRGDVGELSGNSEDDDDDGISSVTIKDLSDGYFQMPYDLMKDNLRHSFKEMFKLIKKSMEKSSIPPSQLPKTKSSPPRQIPSARRTPSVETDKLLKQVQQYKEIIQQQKEFIQQSILNQSKAAAETSYLDESVQLQERLLQEQESMAEQRRLFYQEKANFEEERKQYTEAAIRLGRERKALDDQRSSIINQFLQISPFVKSTPSNRKSQKGEGTRLLPSTPMFSPAPSSKPKTPSTTELYRVLGITPKDLPKRKEDKYSPEEEPRIKKALSSESLLSGSCKSTPHDTSDVQISTRSHSSPEKSPDQVSLKRVLFRRRSSTGSNEDLEGL